MNGTRLSSESMLKRFSARLAVGRMAYEAGSFSQAARHFQMALTMATENSLPIELQARAELGLAKSLAATGKFDTARALLEKVVQEDSEDNFWKVDEAEDYHQLALLYWRSGQNDLSLQCAQQAWKIAETTEDCPHELTAKLLKHFAVLAEQAGHYVECEKYLDQAIDFIEGSPQLGKQSSICGDVLLVKVLLLVDQNRVKEAMELYPRAIQTVEINRGRTHPHVLETLSMFKDFENNRAEQETAEELQQGLLQAQLKSKHGII